MRLLTSRGHLVDAGKRTERASGPQLHITIPKTPNLETRGRKRQHKIVSQAELDEMEVEDVKKYVALLLLVLNLFI